MADTLKFPNGGYEVNVCRKQDILDCIDANIIDKEIALAIVEQCEMDAVNFIKDNRWVSIPFIGNIRIPKSRLMEQDPEQQALIEEAKATLEKDKYVLFRKKLHIENKKQIKNNRYYNYITSIAINKNRKLYRRISKSCGETYAKIYMYSISNITAIDNEYEILLKDES